MIRAWLSGWRLAVGLLTIVPVRMTEADRVVAGRAMTLAPVVGALLGGAAAAVLLAVRALAGPGPLAAVLAVGVLAWLTRGLHLDGLADLADGLGSGRPADQALEVMRKGDVGPFGVVTLVLVLLAQVAALTQAALTHAALTQAALAQTAAVAVVIACVTGRLAVTLACREGVPAARPEGLGSLVAQTVRPRTALLTVAAALVLIAVVSRPGAVAALAGLAAAELLRRRAVRKLGGITGDVLGALVETATTVTLVVYALT